MKINLLFFACFITSLAALDEQQTRADIARMDSESPAAPRLPSFREINVDVKTHFDSISKSDDLHHRLNLLRQIAASLRVQHQQLVLKLLPQHRAITSEADADLFLMYGIARRVSFYLTCKNDQELALQEEISVLIEEKREREAHDMEKQLVYEACKRSREEFIARELTGLFATQITLGQDSRRRRMEQ